MEKIGEILIIDDEKINAETIQDILSDVGYGVQLAFNALEAQEAIKKQDFDLIMMDVWMPGQDGMSLLEQWSKQKLSSPVVMMSGHAQHQDIVRAIKLGASDFLKKPLHDILPFVRKILSSKKLEQEQSIDIDSFDCTLKTARANFERKYFNYHLKQNSYNISKVADITGMERTTLYRKLKELGIDKK